MPMKDEYDFSNAERGKFMTDFDPNNFRFEIDPGPRFISFRMVDGCLTSMSHTPAGVGPTAKAAMSTTTEHHDFERAGAATVALARAYMRLLIDGASKT